MFAEQASRSVVCCSVCWVFLLSFHDFSCLINVLQTANWPPRPGRAADSTGHSPSHLLGSGALTPSPAVSVPRLPSRVRMRPRCGACWVFRGPWGEMPSECTQALSGQCHCPWESLGDWGTGPACLASMCLCRNVSGEGRAPCTGVNSWYICLAFLYRV